jgi:hypothetical protein
MSRALSLARRIAILTAAVGVLICGDSQAAGRGPTALQSPTAPDPALDVATVQSTTYGTITRRIAQAFANPFTIDVSSTGIAAQPYIGTGSVSMMGPEIAIAKVLTRRKINFHITTFAIVGLACAEMVDPAYPVGGPSWINQLITFQQAREAATGIKTRYILVCAGNNDGLVAAKSNNLCLPGANNTGALKTLLKNAFPGAIICWYRIHPDTVNFTGFNPSGVDTIANQNTAFLANPDIIPIDVRNCKLLSDHAHLDADGEYVLGETFIETCLRLDGRGPTRPTKISAFRGFGPAKPANGTIGPQALSSGGTPEPGNLEVLVICDMVVPGALPGSHSTPSTGGWTPYDNATSTATVNNFAVRASLFTRSVTEAMLAANFGTTTPTTIVLDSPATANFAGIFTIAGVDASSPPTPSATQKTTTTAGNVTSLNVGSYTPSGNNKRVVSITVGFVSNSFATNSVTHSGAFAAAQLVRNGVNVCPNTAAWTFDVQSIEAPTNTPLGAMTLTLGRTTTSPVNIMFDV